MNISFCGSHLRDLRNGACASHYMCFNVPFIYILRTMILKDLLEMLLVILNHVKTIIRSRKGLPMAILIASVNLSFRRQPLIVYVSPEVPVGQVQL
jgi:hypothetical protein